MNAPTDPASPSALSRLYDSIVLRRALPVALICLAATAFFALHVRDFKLDASSDSIVLERDAALDTYDRTRRVFGSDDYVFVAFTPEEDVFSSPTLRLIGALRDELEAIGGVESVMSLIDVPLFHSPTVPVMSLGTDYRTLTSPDVDVELARKEIVENPLYRDFLISEDGKTTVIQANFAPNEELESLYDERNALRAKRRGEGLTPEEIPRLKTLEERYAERHVERNTQRRMLIDEVRAVLDNDAHAPLGKLYLGGVPMIVADIIEYVERDIVVFGVGVLLFILLMLAVIFRTWKWILLPTATCIVTLTIMAGYLGWTDWLTTIVTSNFTSLLLIVTVAMTVHIIVRYREFHAGEPDLSHRELMLRAVRGVAVPCLYTSLTTIVGFGSLIVSGIRPVMDFGLMMTIGLSVAYAMCFVFLPSAAMLFGKGPTPPAKFAQLTGSPVAVFARVTQRAGWLIALLSVGAFAYFGFYLSKIEVENSFNEYFKDSTPIHEGMTVIDRRLGGTTPLDVVFEVEGAAATNAETGALEPLNEYWLKHENLEYIGRVHEYLDSLPETGKVISPYTLVKIIEPLKTGSILTRNLPWDAFIQVVRRRIPDNIAKDVLKPYLSEDFNMARIAMRVRETDPTLRRKELLEKIDAYLETEGARTYVTTSGEEARVRAQTTGVFVLYNNMLQSLFDSQIKTIVAVIAAIWMMFLILFRSIKLASIAIVPNVLPVVLVLGTLGRLGIPLDMMTIMVAAVTFGIAVDNTIHYIIRFKAEFPLDRDYKAAMLRCHNSIGRAIFYTSITIVVGFSILSLSQFKPTIYFGLLTGLAMVVALLASLTLLPLMLMWIKPLGPQGSGGRVSV